MPLKSWVQEAKSPFIWFVFSPSLFGIALAAVTAFFCANRTAIWALSVVSVLAHCFGSFTFRVVIGFAIWATEQNVRKFTLIHFLIGLVLIGGLTVYGKHWRARTHLRTQIRQQHAAATVLQAWQFTD